MMKKIASILALTTALAAFNISPAFASHSTKVCTDEVNGGSFRSVLVPEGATCTLIGVQVERDVVVLEGGRLVMLGSSVGDDLRGRSPASIHIDCSPARGADPGTPCSTNSSVGDDVVIVGTSADLDPTATVDPNKICNTFVGDDLEIRDSGAGAPWDIGGGSCTRGAGPTLDAGGNTVLGDMEIEDNAAVLKIDSNDIAKDLEVEDNSAQVAITNNEIGDDLDCDDNSPDPTGFSNEVHDDAKGECSAAAFTNPPPGP